ncbi:MULTISPECIES: hypothetical protein [Streptomyces]|uniref:Uncharacterized protein n=1 Tax=Streptomyces edwardsiae TaxID=3075527 RepID=A0ABU2QKM4_9ACTN|nr:MULTISPECIES: hypothetical protein [unclassified Streptomyces]MDT0403515.1 hypothetical protein [Streptomyces sp. DSM 41635]
MRREDVPDGGDGEVEAVLDELYALPPSDFVARREERAAAARTARRAGDARRIHAARRPTLAAWAANLLRHSRPDEAEQFLELGRALREAYAGLDPGALKELSAQRRRIVSELSRQAALLAREAGYPLSGSAQRDVETTLRAVLADPEAARLWDTGRTETALTPPTGFGAETAGATPARGAPRAETGGTRTPAREAPRARRTGAQATAREPAHGETSGAQAPPRKPSRTPSATARRQDELAERRAERRKRLERAREAARTTEARVRELRTEQDEADASLERARERRREAGERVSAAEERLREARTEWERADREQREAGQRHRTAAHALARAEREARAAAREAEKAAKAVR